MSWDQRGLNINGEADGDFFGYSVSCSTDGMVVAIGAPNNAGGGDDRGHVRVYAWDGNAWGQRGLDIDGEADVDFFGWSVSLSGDGSIIAIGSEYNAGGGNIRGHVRVYAWDGNAWTQRGLDIDGETDGDHSGYSVSLSRDGSIVAIGAPNNASNRGRVRVYVWNGNAWGQRGLNIDGEADGDRSGHSVSLSGDGSIVAIGAPKNASDRGHVRVYVWNGNAWGQRGLDIDGEATGDYSGWSVSLSTDGSIVAIGAPNNASDRGRVRVHAWNGNAWVQRGLDIDGEAGDYSGWSVSLSGDGLVVAIGATYHDSAKGHVRVYAWDGNAWGQRGLDIDGEATGDYSGWSVSLSRDGLVVAIGAYHNAGGGDERGHARVYSYVPPICFLADAPVLTPTGYRPISSLTVGDIVRTSAGRTIAVKRVFTKEYKPSTSANPFVIQKGMFGALRALPISPNHEVMVPGKGMMRAKHLGLRQMKMSGPFTYYNLELEDWVRDNLVVAGVECESLAPAERIIMTKAEFMQFVKARYEPSAASRLRTVCFEEANGSISLPALR